MKSKWTQFPTCPYCGNGEEDGWEGDAPTENGDERVVKCVACDREYATLFSLTPEYASFGLEEVSE